MDTIATIIHSIPEPLAIAVLTATFSGIVVYFVQKRIESAYSSKLEEFRVNLQKSLFEHQTKFVRHHTKAVETLELLYQKLIVISNRYEELVDSAISFYKQNQKFVQPMDLRLLGLNPKDIDDLHSKSKDFFSCFDSNRLYFPASSIREIIGIRKRIDILIQLLPYYMGLLVDFDDASLEYFNRLNESIEQFDFIKHRTIEDEWDFLPLFYDFADEMNRQTERLENLYKSVSDIQD